MSLQMLVSCCLLATFVTLTAHADSLPMGGIDTPSSAVPITDLGEATALLEEERVCGQWEERGTVKVWCIEFQFDEYTTGQTELRGTAIESDGLHGDRANVKLVKRASGELILVGGDGSNIRLFRSTEGGRMVIYFDYGKEESYPAVASAAVQ